MQTARIFWQQQELRMVNTVTLDAATAANATTPTGDGANVILTAGSGGETSGNGGNISLLGGSAIGGGAGGDPTIQSGEGEVDGSGGDIDIIAGGGGDTAGTGGEISIQGGNASSG